MDVCGTCWTYNLLEFPTWHLQDHLAKDAGKKHLVKDSLHLKELSETQEFGDFNEELVKSAAHGDVAKVDDVVLKEEHTG